MNEKYAVFIWGSYAVTVAVLVWNWLSPRLARNELRARLSEAQQDSDS